MMKKTMIALLLLVPIFSASAQRVASPTANTQDVRYKLNERNDCSVLALSVAFEKEYITVHRHMTYLDVREHGKGVPLHVLSSNMHLLAERMDAVAVPMYGGATSYTLSEFASTFDDGVFIVVVDGHVVCVDDGVVYDTSRRHFQKQVRATWMVAKKSQPLNSYTY